MASLRRTSPVMLILWLLMALLLVVAVDARKSLPRSSASRRRLDTSSTTQQQPPWNPSSLINPDGFLKQLYDRKNGDWEEQVRLRTAFHTDLPCQIRQVPGDGNCLFHSLSLCLAWAQNGTHWDITSPTGLAQLYDHSQHLRSRAVATLRQGRRRLFLQGRETLRASELVEAAAQQYDLSPEEYCQAMQEECVWGGGPEIVALCNLLQRPIHVYELAVMEPSSSSSPDNDDDDGTANNKRKKSRDGNSPANPKEQRAAAPPCFVLRRMACFGSPRFDRRQALHILSADSRFPDLHPGQQLAAGNHFLAVFPQKRRKRRGRLRGGAGATISSSADSLATDGTTRDDDDTREDPLLVWWWKGFWRLLLD